LLLQPFFCAAILGRRWDWLYVPALALALTAFIMREPLLVLARQRWKWRDARTESEAARRCLLWQAPLGAIAFLLCLRSLPTWPLLALAGAAAGITLLALWMTLHNRQRSVALQLLSSTGLTASGLLAALVAARDLPGWSWLLCALLGSHAIASILVVRTRLELRSGSPARMRRKAWAVQTALAGLAIALANSGEPGLGAVAGFSAFVNALELVRLRSREKQAEPLRRVGFRTLGTSLAHSVFTVAALW
jgi:hypothetical protein